jgi:hypothetical protein
VLATLHIRAETRRDSADATGSTGYPVLATDVVRQDLGVAGALEHGLEARVKEAEFVA